MTHPVRIVLLAAVLLLAAAPAAAQDAPAVPASAEAPVVLTLSEALQVALARNYTVRSARLDVANAAAQVKEGWGQLMPQADLSSGYTRNLKTSNPFAGSEAGGFFSTLGFIDWLAYNEQARTDGDPGTNPIPLESFLERQQAGLEAAGGSFGGSDNPFGVPNQFRTSLTVSQPLFDARAFYGARGADRYLVPFFERALDRQEQLLVDDVQRSFYAALLAQEQAQVVAQSVDRTRETLDETARRVAQGVAPKYQRLSTEVALANLETQLVQTQNAAVTAADNLKLVLGLPVEQPVRLRGDLDVDPDGFMTVAEEAALATALAQRPDLERADLNVALQKVQLAATRAEYFPRVNATATASYLGSVPDDRTSFIADPSDPFSYQERTTDFFDTSYWDWDVNVGVSLTWNLFNGFQTRQRAQQNKIAVEQASIEQERLQQAVQLEVEAALRDLRAARQRIVAQRQNLATAELNYEFAEARLREGVATPLEERDASEQLDQSRLNYLQAMHDYLVARSALATALGTPSLFDDDLQLTSN